MGDKDNNEVCYLWQSRDERMSNKKPQMGRKLSFVKKFGKFNSEPIPTVDRDIGEDGLGCDFFRSLVKKPSGVFASTASITTSTIMCALTAPIVKP